MIWLLVAGTLAFTLPAREAADFCAEAEAPCTDLDSVFLWRQDAVIFQSPKIIKRAGVFGMEGQPYSFTYDCPGTCQYFVTTKDWNGNQSCPSAIVQIGGTTGVPQSPFAHRASHRFDLQGRRMTPSASGIYFSPDSSRRVVRR